MNRSDGLVQRRNVSSAASKADPSRDPEDDSAWSDAAMDPNAVGEEEDHDSKETRLTLMEEILLLGLKDKEVVGEAL